MCLWFVGGHVGLAVVTELVVPGCPPASQVYLGLVLVSNEASTLFDFKLPFCAMP